MKTLLEDMEQALGEFDVLRRLGSEPYIGNSVANTIANTAYLYLEAAIYREKERIKPRSEKETLAWMYQHEETGRVGFIDQCQVDWGFEKGNPRLRLLFPLCKKD
jgi:hypothetical protein